MRCHVPFEVYKRIEVGSAGATGAFFSLSTGAGREQLPSQTAIATAHVAVTRSLIHSPCQNVNFMPPQTPIGAPGAKKVELRSG
jgi:hypothetical protein